MRRRELRSAASQSERRAASNRRPQEQETQPESSFAWRNNEFRILHANIRGLISHAANLAERICEMQDRPNLICVNETFFDRTIEHNVLKKHMLIARLDK